ncbi:3-methyl-2-oxobutanoate hydroxymethyltransferase [Streptomyces brasiliensis]|uniref:3-methyl-2-oxobutanoate hydroxymethyltransferase n=1 Tax=Streptomyces brasiliensis TaxID=1954 RepID=A0A917K3E7_9ACTN|nr:3-methyl-2-oxobutanoate hydroxymethyltransferase [Streptomyces brasiliensis]GGI95537.1 hypothetical protein GCM10010121_002470 [Streptomyces brasiliensis]
MTTATRQLSESARAASASESRYRIDVPIAPARAARVIALDERAAAVARHLAERPWAHARFFTADRPFGPEGRLRRLAGGGAAGGRPGAGGSEPPSESGAMAPGEMPAAPPGWVAAAPPDTVPDVPLDEALTGSDVVVVLATEDGGRDVAAAIGRFCGRRGITTAGVVLGDGFEADDAVAALRPYARVLLLSADESDAFELLTALRV